MSTEQKAEVNLTMEEIVRDNQWENVHLNPTLVAGAVPTHRLLRHVVGYHTLDAVLPALSAAKRRINRAAEQAEQAARADEEKDISIEVTPGAQ